MKRTRLLRNYRTNDGIVEGVWIFGRHGDRTPSRTLSPAHRVAEEANFWRTRLPHEHTFQAYFPEDIHPNNGPYLDTNREPFGYLTHQGVEQWMEIGKRFFNRYDIHGHHLASRQHFRNKEDFLEIWDTSVYSTNYLRTITSVQSFLDGLLDTQCYRKGKQDVSSIKPILPVTVRDLKHDPLNAFDRNPDLMADLVARIVLADEFQKRDSLAAPLAARLANILPGLVRPRRSNFSSKTPSGINWVEASDHFICREAHHLPFSKFTDFEHDQRVEQLLRGLKDEVLKHLSWRFRQWYLDKPLLAAVTAPPLREIVDQMTQIPDMKERDKRPFILYSCHDITILGILYGIGAHFLQHEWHKFWPVYGSTMVFELVRTDNSYVVRILLNGKPVRSVNEKGDVGHGPEQLMLIDDFLALVEKLEKDGGHDYKALLSLD